MLGGSYKTRTSHPNCCQPCLKVLDATLTHPSHAVLATAGHALDQKRLQQPLYRHPWEDVLYTH